MAEATDAGQDHKKLLLQEILDELKKQGELKKALLKELQPTSARQTLLEISKHPVILLIIGSLFGGWLSSCYQRREWDRQQIVLSEQRKYDQRREQGVLSKKQQIEQKMALRDQVMEAIVNAQAAAQSAVRDIFYGDSASFVAKEKSRTEAWDKANTEWQAARSKLPQKVDLYFGPEIATKFQDIVDTRNPKGNFIHVDVSNLLAEAKQNPSVLDDEESPQCKDLRDRIRKNVLGPIGGMKERSKDLMRLMHAHIQADISTLFESQAPQ